MITFTITPCPHWTHCDRDLSDLTNDILCAQNIKNKFGWNDTSSSASMDRTMYGKVDPGARQPFRCAVRERGLLPGCKWRFIGWFRKCSGLMFSKFILLSEQQVDRFRLRSYWNLVWVAVGGLCLRLMILFVVCAWSFSKNINSWIY